MVASKPDTVTSSLLLLLIGYFKRFLYKQNTTKIADFWETNAVTKTKVARQVSVTNFTYSLSPSDNCSSFINFCCFSKEHGEQPSPFSHRKQLSKNPS